MTIASDFHAPSSCSSTSVVPDAGSPKHHAKCKPWSVPSRCCEWVSVMLRASLTATSGTHYYLVHRPRCAHRPGIGGVQAAPPASRVTELLAGHRSCVPPDLDVHLIVANYGTHKHAKVRTTIAGRSIRARTTALMDCTKSKTRGANAWLWAVSPWYTAIRHCVFSVTASTKLELSPLPLVLVSCRVWLPAPTVNTAEV